MVFFLNLLVTISYSYGVGHVTKKNHYTPAAIAIMYVPLFVIWVLIAGLQYYVGTDYPAYMSHFNGHGVDQYYKTGEVGYAWFVEILNSIGVHGNAIYCIFYSVSFIFLMFSVRRSGIDNRDVFVFLLLLISFTGLFNNQLNMLRQAVAIYIGTYGALQIIQCHRLKGLMLIAIAASIHLAAWIFVLFFLSPIVRKISKKWLCNILIMGGVAALTLSVENLDWIMDYLPVTYAWHLKEGVEQRTGFLLLTKFMFLPLFFLSLKHKEKYGLSTFQETLYNWGVVGFGLKLGLLGMTIVSRLADYWLLFSIFPLYHYLAWLWHSRKRQRQILAQMIILALIAFYFLKTCVFPTGEYDYHSILPLIF